MNSFIACLVVMGLFNSAVSDNPVSLTRNKRETEACFCHPELGCFYNNYPWSSPTRPFPCPGTPDEVGTKFLFFSRNSSEAYTITQWPTIILEGSGYDPSKPTIIIVHGYNGVKFFQWMYDLKDVLLEKGDVNTRVNIMVVDWSKGSGTSFNEYTMAAANTRVVGGELARVLEELISAGQAPSNIHCIGHSLGCHICGYAAKELNKQGKKIGQITGLDCAQPGFEGESEDVRVTKGDVTLLVVWHTDGVRFIPCLGFGCVGAMGHIDFMVNRGSNQPGCSFANVITSVKSVTDLANIPENVQMNRACSHKKVTDFYVAAMKQEGCFTGKKMSSDSISRVINSMVCVNVIPETSDVESCSEDTCIQVGTETLNTTVRGSFYVKALGEPPYCKKNKRSATESPENDSIWETMASPFIHIFQPLRRLMSW